MSLYFQTRIMRCFDNYAQKVAFMRYRGEGGVAIHSASGTERPWDWFKQLLGGTFLWHEPYQKFTVRILEGNYPYLAHLPGNWEREEFDGGRQWYTSLDHNREDYKDQDYCKYILGGIQWVVGNREPLDYNKAYAQ